MTEIIQDSIDPKAVELLKTDPAAFFANSGRGRRDAEQANADFYYRLGNTTQLEAVGEDALDTHMTAPIFAELQRESQHYLQDDEVTFEPSLWDRAEDVLDTQRTAYVVWLIALALGLTLGFIGWLALVSA